MNQYLTDIRSIVNRYTDINTEMNELLEQVKLVDLRKKQVELKLAQTREDERALIDKIKNTTGETPDFYKILQELNHESVTVD
jgi:hypothetical protein